MAAPPSAAQPEPLDVLWAFALRHRSAVSTVAVFAVFVGLLTLVTPIAVQELVNTAAFGTVLQPVVVLVALLLLALTFAGVLKLQKSWVVEVLQRRMFIDAVSRLAYLLPRVDAASPAFQHMGEPVHRFFDLFKAQKALAALLLGGVDLVLTAGVGLLVLAAYHPLLLAFALGLLLVLVLLLILGRNGVRTAVDESTAKHELAERMAEVVDNPYAFRHGSGQEYARARFDEVAGQYLRARGAHFRVVMRQLAVAVLTQAIASAALLGIGGFLVIERELTLGQLVAAELIVTLVVGAFGDLSKYLESYYDLAAAVYKLDTLLELPVEAEVDRELDSRHDGPAALSIGELSLTLGNRALLDRAELDIAAGERVLLVGQAESGKSTWLDILYGLRRADHGVMQIDGHDVRELSKRALRSRVALVRGPEVVAGSVIDNVVLGHPGVTLADVRRVLEMVGLEDELARLPEGLETRLGPGGARLSYSQALRLTLARALARMPGLVAVDADLSAVDAVTFTRTMRMLAAPDAPWTVIAVGEIARLCAPPGMRIVRLHEGRFIEEGRT